MKKFLCLLLCCSMFGLYGCTDIMRFFGDVDPEVIVERIEDVLEEEAADDLHVEVEYDKGFDQYVVSLWLDEFDEITVSLARIAFTNQSIEGAGAVVRAWNELTASLTGLSVQLQKNVSILDDNAVVVVKLLNAENHEDVLFSVVNGVVEKNLTD